jgi:hypothetical protein
MKNVLVAAAIIVGSCSFALAQGGAGGGGAGGGGAGGEVSTPRKSVPRVGTMKRDDSMNAGQRTPLKHARHKKHKKKQVTT